MQEAKSFEISKHLVWEAYLRVKQNKGSGGVDGVEIEEFEKDVKNNLYKLWNRMSSGSYLPKPVRLVEIPKEKGGIRTLGIPTIEDRIAQMVAVLVIEPMMESNFHEDSYGYRRGKSAHQALEVARRRCWRYNWVVDLDISRYFDSIDHELLMKAVSRHTETKWVLLFISRWLTVPYQLKDGERVERNKGVPQGSVIGPLLSNLFLHYAFDEWMRRAHPNSPFERYVDDAIIHCSTEEEAKVLREAISKRFAECGLELNEDKTRIVYCKDDDRRGSYVTESFDFLGYAFRARRSKNKWGKHFINFSPAISNKAKKKIGRIIRHWKLNLRSDKTLEDLSNMFNKVLRGWINYYGKFYKSAMVSLFSRLNERLTRWAVRKFKRFRRKTREARYWLGKVAAENPRLFAHWNLLGIKPPRAEAISIINRR